ncbi:SDR family NAD(P)-dependent oxidoreductase [Streptomyces sp. NBC_01477]|uniref:SDR family NAD(P)-dependent oxidoreductase n=1 Tax=Streptomyces sp. NBC_01477 TaxID=2976015 RepID=UPI002E2FE848|nr:SDR family NAD(P)-dependent oxidoreductase [Streptomyces sp. NBC_01477]
MTRPLALVTGATGGLGRACATALYEEGYALGLLARDEQALSGLADELIRRGAEVHTAVADLRSTTSAEQAVQRLTGHGELRALVNAAGVISLGTIAEVDAEEWDRVVDSKLRAAYVCCRTALPHLAEQASARNAGTGGTAIVNIASTSGRTRGIHTSPAYVAANAGIIGLTMSLAAQCAPLGVRVNCVAPGLISTPMLRVYNVQQLTAMRRMIPAGRFARPAEIAQAVVFLATDRASYITGETLNVNGGTFMV